MPIYEYRCRTCGETFAKLQRMGAGSDDVRCPHCQSGEVERTVSSFASGTSPTRSGASTGCGGGSGFG